MNLKKKYRQLFEGKSRSNDSVLTEAPPMKQAFPRMRTAAEKQAAGVVDRQPGREMTYPEPLDIEYFSDQINTMIESIDEFHQELGSQVEMKGDESGDYQYETMEKQLSRYINVAQKGLENLQKYLERQKGKGL